MLLTDFHEDMKRVCYNQSELSHQCGQRMDLFLSAFSERSLSDLNVPYSEHFMQYVCPHHHNSVHYICCHIVYLALMIPPMLCLS